MRETDLKIFEPHNLVYLKNIDIKIFGRDEKQQKNILQTIRVYRQETGTELRTEKCAWFKMKNRKRETVEGMELPNQESIRGLGEK